MKATRSYLIVMGVLLLSMGVSHLVSLYGYFQSVEGSGSGGISDKKMFAQLQQLNEQLKSTSDPDVAKRLLRGFEGFVGQGSDGAEKWKRTYAPLTALFASKPKEAEDRYLLVKKRELMENLVNAYRKEIPNGPVPVRAQYLNILFDTQNSLLNEGDETEQVYIKRNKERFASLRSMVSGPADQGLGFRVGGLESIFQAYERGFEMSSGWKKQKSEILASIDKTLPKLSREFLGSHDGQIEDQRRFFLYSCVFGIIMGLACLLILYASHKVLKIRSYTRIDAFLRYVKDFGRERQDPSFERDLRLLRDDPDWAAIAKGITDSEMDFQAEFNTLLAVPRSIQTPFLVFNRDKVAKFWNPAAAAIFGIDSKSSATLETLIREEKFSSREGASGAVVEMIRNSFSAPKVDSFELLLQNGEAPAPYELLSYPIVNGPLAGGKIYLFREIRSEAERIQRAVAAQLEKVREIVHKVSHQYPVDWQAIETDQREVREAMADLEGMKRKLEEREALWKAERAALGDQVGRQKELLERLSGEIQMIRTAHAKAAEIIATVHGSDENWHEEVCTMEREMERWRSMRGRLENDLNQFLTTVDKARAYEKQTRAAAQEIEGFLKNYDLALADLRAYSEEAKVHAVNLAFSKDPAQREYAARSRAYAHEIGRFVEQTSKLATRVKTFLSAHPASALAAHLEQGELDPDAVESLRKEEERLDAFVKRWSESGREILAGGERALEMLRQLDKKGAVAIQLGETSLLINEQARSNLERWN